MKIIIVTGATASGKSAYALQLAQQINGAIINADSMQLYADAPILTAQPSLHEQAQVPHLLYGVLKADDVCNVARYIELARKHIHDTWQAGQKPILTGGTGLYLKAITQGIAKVPTINPDIREEVRALEKTALWQSLQQEDPQMAMQLSEHDTQRIARALEVMRSSGKSLLWWQAQPHILPFPNASFEVIVTEIPRNQLYQRIDARYLQMLQNGGLEEAKQLIAKNYSDELPLMRAVGVRQLINHLQGDYSLEQAIIAGQTASRQYAKRQLTWIRNQWRNYEIAPTATQ
jgi:tRNA dimethylallyltransferase